MQFAGAEDRLQWGSQEGPERGKSVTGERERKEFCNCLDIFLSSKS